MKTVKKIVTALATTAVAALALVGLGTVVGAAKAVRNEIDWDELCDGDCIHCDGYRECSGINESETDPQASPEYQPGTVKRTDHGDEPSPLDD